MLYRIVRNKTDYLYKNGFGILQKLICHKTQTNNIYIYTRVRVCKYMYKPIMNNESHEMEYVSWLYIYFLNLKM